MNDDTAPRWGRAGGHRIQHAWEPEPGHAGSGIVFAMCEGVLFRQSGTIDYDSDAARCERCAARLKRREASA